MRGVYEFDESKFDRSLRWLSVVSMVLFIAMVGAAFGSVQTAYWIADQVESRFECTEK